jgi:hypothetical protein
MAISLLHFFKLPSAAVTVRSSLTAPEAPAVKLIDGPSLAEVISPLMIDQAYSVPAVEVEATLPVDPAQTAAGASMVQ